MPARRDTKVLPAVIAGALLALVSPAVAHAETAQSSATKSTPHVAATPPKVSVGTARLKNLKSGKHLQAASTANGARVTQQPYDGPNELQQWDIFIFGDYYTFENTAAGRNLGIDGASTSGGAAAIIANGSSDLNQDWEVDWTVYDQDGYFALKNRKSGLCLGISGASTANGAQAAQFKCDGSANQGWTWP
ncbi:RICIN domain-containing protein [Streptomyces sp. enrichment culture]|uniref:RICIN domain-containing protein n=1 Tax=Streptomyces sp. enrichment culture TaxID=1795815 RepID=UPI003F55F954